MSNQEDKFDPLEDIKNFIFNLYQSGKLPIILLGFVIIYNLIFFTFPSGYELYLLIPAIGVMFLIVYQYWNKKDDQKAMIISATVMTISAGLDLLVSFTFMFTSSGTLDFRSVPTLIVDLLAVLLFVGWYSNFMLSSPRN